MTEPAASWSSRTTSRRGPSSPTTSPPTATTCCRAPLRDALRTLEYHHVDLAVVDVGLPDGSGLELIRKVREAGGAGSRLDARLPLLVVSGRAGETDRVRGFERGADDFVAKPFSYGELRLRVAALLRRSRERRSEGRLRVGELERRPARARGAAARRAGRALAEGVRAAAAARRRAHASLDEGRAAARRLGLPRARRDAHARQPRVPAAPEARRARRALRDQRLGRRLPARRRDVGEAARPPRPPRWGTSDARLRSPPRPAGVVALPPRSRPWPRSAARRARGVALVAEAAHELRAPLSAALLGLHGLVADAAGARRVAAVELELRRAGLALEDLDAAPRGRRAPELRRAARRARARSPRRSRAGGRSPARSRPSCTSTAPARG